MDTIKKQIESLDDVNFELNVGVDIDITAPVEKDSKHYVDNKVLYQEFVKYHKLKQDWIEAGNEGNPPIKSNIIGKAILQIAMYSANRHYYVRYTNSWKEEMIGRAIERCVHKCHLFDPTKLNSQGNKPSPFSYLTQICDNAFKEQIKTEKTEIYKKYKMIDANDAFFGDLDDNVNAGDLEDYNRVDYTDRLNYINNFEQRLKDKKFERKQKNRKIKTEGLVMLFEDVNDDYDEDIETNE